MLLEFFWWASVFLLAVPVMLLLLVLGPRLLPEFRDPGAGRLDLVSAGSFAVAVLAVVYGIKDIAENGRAGSSRCSRSARGSRGRHRVRASAADLARPLIDLRLFH